MKKAGIVKFKGSFGLIISIYNPGRVDGMKEIGTLEEILARRE